MLCGKSKGFISSPDNTVSFFLLGLFFILITISLNAFISSTRTNSTKVISLARRVCNYTKVEDQFTQGGEYGFIKFGSRVDLLLPVNATIHAKIGDVVKGGVTVLASW